MVLRGYTQARWLKKGIGMRTFPVDPIPSDQDLVRNYRQLASRCREMANRCRRPAPLLLRAAAFDEAAECQLQRTVTTPVSR